MFGGLRDSSLEPEKGAPIGIRIQRRISRIIDDEHPSEPPPSVPPPPESCSSSASDDDSDKTQKTEIRIATLRKDKSRHEPLTERDSYVEEPPSTTTTLDRRQKMSEEKEKERALMRRITNEMQMARFIPMQNQIPYGGAFSNGVYRFRPCRYMESCMRKILWTLGKSLANRKLLFALIPLLFVILPTIGTWLNRENLSFSSPLNQLLPPGKILSNGLAGARPQPLFNHSNAAFSAIDFTHPNTYAILVYTKLSRDSILRKDAALAYSTLKKKLDDFPFGKKEYLEVCSVDCEIERDTVDRVVKKSHQVVLTYPETFVSMSRDASNLSRVYVGSTIGGVDTDSDTAISRAQSLLMNFHLREDLTDEQSRSWSRNFQEQVEHTSAGNVSFLRWSPAQFFAQTETAFSSLHRWLFVPAILLLIFCFIASFGSNAYQSKPMVGISSGFNILISCLGGLATHLSGASNFDPLLWSVVFPISGIGLVWLLQLHLSWQRFSFAAVHPKEKIAFILAHDGPGLVFAGVTLVITFFVLGFFAPSIHMSASFITIAASLALLVFFSLMFLAVFIYIGGRREAKGVKWYQFFKTGDTHFTAPNLTEFDSSALFNLHDRLLDSRPSFGRNLAAKLIGNGLTRGVIIVLGTVYLLVALLGCWNASIDIREEYFLPKSSEEAKFVDKYKEFYGKTTQFMEVIIDEPLDYNEIGISETINGILEEAVTNGYAARSVSWLSEFQKFEKGSIYDVNDDTFVPVVNLVFLATEPYKRFAADVVFDRFQTQIIRSRMYLELTPKGVEQRTKLAEMLLTRASAAKLPLAVRAPFTASLQHDIEAISTVLRMLGLSVVCLFLLSVFCFGQPAMTILLLFTSVLVIIECIGFSVFWSVPLNVVTFTMILAGNSLTCVIVMTFCYSYSISGKGQMRAVARMQYTFQATLLPVVFACLVPTVLYTPLLLLNIPIVSHIWKVLVINSAASLIHYLLFLPNLLLFLTEHFPSCKGVSCVDLCCEYEDDNSIYYIPTTGRSVHPERMYPPYGLKAIHGSPPNYLAITGAQSSPYIVEYGVTGEHHPRRSRSRATDRKTPSPTTPASRRHRSHQSHRDDSIYEAPPSPRRSPSSRSESPRRAARSGGFYDENPRWAPYPPQPQPFVFYPAYR